MNLLFYCDEYPPYKTGGIGSVTQIVAEALAARGHRVFVVGYYFMNRDLPVYSVVNGVRVYRLNLGYRMGTFRKRLFNLGSKLGFSRMVIQREVDYTEGFIGQLVEKERIEVVEFPDYYDWDAYAKGKLRFRKFACPTVLRLHGCVSYVEAHTKGLRWWTKANDTSHFNRCDYISAVSRSALQYVQEHFVLRSVKESVVIYNPLEGAFVKRQPQAESKEILFVGRLTESKGCATLLRAFNLVVEKFPDWSLRIVAGGEVEPFRRLLSPLAEKRVRFMGYCTRQQIQSFIDEAAFACIPTYFETFGMVATEIMGRTRCLIFTETTSGPEIVTSGVDGLLVNPKSPEEVARAMEELIRHPEQRKVMAERAYEKVVSTFVTDRILVELEAFYARIVTLSARGCAHLNQ